MKAASLFRCNIEELLEGIQGKSNLPRLVAMFLVKKHTNLTIADIATHFQTSESSVSALLTRNRALLQTNQEAFRAIGDLETELKVNL